MERIRKLTPKECWRLQGFSAITQTESGYEFDDTLFERAESVCSNSQLYKQAGNSITVDVLYYICKNLFYPEDSTEFDEKENGQFTLSGI